MPSLKLRLRSAVPFALVAGLVFGVIGCGGGDGVQTYTAPKEGGGPAQQQPGGGGAAAGEYRILGAMYPAEDPEWFFKLPGPADELAKHEAGFDKLIASVSLPPGGTPEFDTPEGWKRGPGRAGIVVATVRTPDGKYEVTVTSSKGGVLGNLKRWATDPGQLGNRSFDAADIPKVTKPIDAKGVKGLKADLRGPSNPGGKGGPMMGGR